MATLQVIACLHCTLEPETPAYARVAKKRILNNVPCPLTVRSLFRAANSVSRLDQAEQEATG